MDGPRVAQELKRDALGRVERLEWGREVRIRRVADGGRLPGSGLVARALLGRERAAIAALDGLEGTPGLEADPVWLAAPDRAGAVPPARACLVRSFLAGSALHRAEVLPEDFFARLEELVRRMHARGVCHNDLHKEQNVVVLPDGRPALIDFQLASVHARWTRSFDARCAEDLRHVQKHHRRYTRFDRGPDPSTAAPGAIFEGERARRGLLARAWRRGGKPVYNFVTRRLLGTRDGEERRPNEGPWPRWAPPVGSAPDRAPR